MPDPILQNSLEKESRPDIITPSQQSRMNSTFSKLASGNKLTSGFKSKTKSKRFQSSDKQDELFKDVDVVEEGSENDLLTPRKINLMNSNADFDNKMNQHADLKLRDKKKSQIDNDIQITAFKNDSFPTIRDVIKSSIIENTRTPENKKDEKNEIEFLEDVEIKSDQSPQRNYKSIIVKDIEKLSPTAIKQY